MFMIRLPGVKCSYSLYLSFLLLFIPILPVAADGIPPGNSGVGYMDLDGTGGMGTITATDITAWSLSVGDNEKGGLIHIQTDSTGWSVTAQDSRTPTPSGLMSDDINSLIYPLMIKNIESTPRFISLENEVLVASGTSAVDENKEIYLLQHVEPNDHLTSVDPIIPYSINIIYTLTY